MGEGIVSLCLSVHLFKHFSFKNHLTKFDNIWYGIFTYNCGANFVTPVSVRFRVSDVRMGPKLYKVKFKCVRFLHVKKIDIRQNENLSWFP
jgi:hypothetical protein